MPFRHKFDPMGCKVIWLGLVHPVFSKNERFELVERMEAASVECRICTRPKRLNWDRQNRLGLYIDITGRRLLPKHDIFSEDIWEISQTGLDMRLRDRLHP